MPIAGGSSLMPETLAALSARPAVPSWLVSLIVHLLGLLILALSFTRDRPGVRGGVSLTMSLAESEAPGSNTPEVVIAPMPADGGASAAAAATAATTAPITSLAEALGGGPPIDPSHALPAAVALGAGTLEHGVGTAQGTTGPKGGGLGGGLQMGGKARVGVFGTEGEGYKFVYVFDRSASMGGSGRNALDAAKAELLASLEHLDKTHQFQIIFYNEQLTKFNPTGDPDRLVFATEQNKALARRFVGGITAENGTRHEEAISAAIKLRPDVIFFLTDADEPKLWPPQLARLHRMAAGITINAIEFGFGPQTDPNNFLVRLARENGGKHVYFDVSKLLATGY